MRFLIDENIPLARELFEQMGEVDYARGTDISSDKLKKVDVLLVRSVTRVNAGLLDGSSVKVVGTATAGEDHIDKEYLKDTFSYILKNKQRQVILLPTTAEIDSDSMTSDYGSEVSRIYTITKEKTDSTKISLLHERGG